MNDQQIVHLLRMGADTLQRVINRNQKLDQEINALKAKYQKDVEQIRKIAEELISKYNSMNVEEEKKAVVEAVNKAVEAVQKDKPPKKYVFKPPTLPRIMPYTPLFTIPNLEPRVYSAFKTIGAKSVKDLEKVTYSQLIRLPNVGERTVNQIRYVMQQAGYTMRDR